MIPPLVVRRPPGLQDYRAAWQAMQAFTDRREPDTPDELWLLEHHPVFTLGQAGREEHCLAPGDIPLIRTDRGGQVTYHGPGQLVAYLLFDLRRARTGVKQLVETIEWAVIDLLAESRITAEIRPGAPGVYVGPAKIASVGLRVRNGCSYHGLALNCTNDLSPFDRIDPCGYPGLAMTRMSDHCDWAGLEGIGESLARILCARLGVTLADTRLESFSEW